MERRTVLLDLEAGVATITLNRPERLNALDLELGCELRRVLAEAETNADIRSLVLTGRGRAFCSGGDVRVMRDGLDAGQPAAFFEGPLGVFHEVILAMRRLAKPIVTAVNGPAMGAGMNLALGADIVYASRDAVFSQAFVRLGLVPDCGGTFFLPRLIGMARAAEMVFTGDTIDAEQALKLGLVSRVVPQDQLLSSAWELARRLARGPTAAIGRMKALLQDSLQNSLEDMLRRELLAQIDSGRTDDFREGLTAFTEKRTPDFLGR